MTADGVLTATTPSGVTRTTRPPGYQPRPDGMGPGPDADPEPGRWQPLDIDLDPLPNAEATIVVDDPPPF